MRRSPRLFCAAVLFAVVALPAGAAECVMPGAAPAMPQGATVSPEAMTAGKVARDQYVSAVQAFKECQLKRISTARKSTSPEDLQKWRDSVNAADDAITSVHFLYQAQLWAYEYRLRHQR